MRTVNRRNRTSVNWTRHSAGAPVNLVAVNIRDRPFERALRRRVREEVRRSPALWMIYARGLWSRRIEAAMTGIAIALGIAGFPFLALAYNAMLIGPGLFIKDPELPPGANPSVLVLLGPAALLTGIAAIVVLELIISLRQGRELSVLACLPYTDRMWGEHLRRKLSLGRYGLLCLLGGFVLPGWLWLAWTHRLGPAGWVAGIAAILLHWPLTVATAALIAAAVPRAMMNVCGHVTACVVMQLGIFGPLFLALAGVPRAPEGIEIASWLFLLLPAGWVQGILQMAILDGQPAGWLFLVPTAAVIAAGYRWLGQGFAIRELILGSDRTVSIIYQRDLAATADLLTTMSSPPADCEAIDDEASVRRALAESFDWRPRGPIERLAARVLNPRQRTIIEFWWAGPPRWTRRLLFGLPALLAVAALLGSHLVLPADGLRLTGVMAAAVFAFAALPSFSAFAGAHSCSASGVAAGGMLNTWHPAYPVGYGEVLAAALKVELIQACAWALPLAATGGAVAWQQQLPLADGVLVGLTSAVVALLWIVVFWATSFLFRIDLGNLRSLVLLPLTYVYGLGIVLMPGMIAVGYAPAGEGAGPVPWDDSSAVRFLAAGLLLATTTLWCAAIGWLFRRRIIDFR